MANFKGFKQVSLATYQATSEENRKDYLWLVRELSGETVISSSIYFGNRKYADLTGEVEDVRVAKIITSLGSAIDENGEWVGFLPIEEHEILANSAITSVSDALEALEAAILNNADAISGKVDKSEFDEKVAELEEKIDKALSGETEAVEALSGKVEEIEVELAKKADADDVEALNDKVDALDEEITDALSAVTEELATKADADDVYTKDEVYTKEETDAKVAGAFKFKGDAESISADETTLIVNGEPIVASEENVGFVYQIDDAEYASNGEKWVKLGFNIDLTNYATKDFVNSAISEEAAAREALADEIELVESALTAEINAREELGEVVEDINERATITANTFSDAEEIEDLRLGRIVYVLNDETVSGITYGSGAYINTQAGLKKLDATTPTTSTTLEERVETLENKVADIEVELGDATYEGDSITAAIATIQEKLLIEGDDIEE